MAKKQLGIRLETGTIAALDGYAEAHGISRTEAVERAVEALTGAQGPQVEKAPGTDMRAVCDVLRESNADLRKTVSTLTAQLAVKDEQIRQAHDLADHSQRLHMAEVQRSLPAPRLTMREKLRRMMNGEG